MESGQKEILSYAAVAAAWRAAYRQSLVENKPVDIPFSQPWRVSKSATEELAPTDPTPPTTPVPSPIPSATLSPTTESQETTGEEVGHHGGFKRFSWASSISSEELDFGYDSSSPTPPASLEQTKFEMTLFAADLPDVTGCDGTINRIMDETETQIQLRYQHVLVNGTMERVEQARVLLREESPLTMIFLMRVTSRHPRFYEAPLIRKMESDLNVTVTFLYTPEDGVYEVLVQGKEAEPRRVKEAIRRLSDCSLGKAADSTVVIKMKVSVELWRVLSANDEAIMKTVMHATQTVIALEGTTSKLTISGSMQGVHDAKRELLACHPVELTFEVDQFTRDYDEIKEIANRHDVEVVFGRVNGASFLCLMGVERFVHQVYEACEEVLTVVNAMVGTMQEDV